jgi:23S rRNA U2552 (ribose-2'-O)-methylase RlmE/FtsJ
MNGEKTLKIVIVASSPETETFHWAMQDIMRGYGKIIDLHFYHLSAVDEELIDENIFREDLQAADVVLLDIRPQQRGAEIISEVLSETNNTVIVLFAASSTIWQLARLGSFVMKKYAKREVEYDLDSEENG